MVDYNNMSHLFQLSLNVQVDQIVFLLEALAQVLITYLAATMLNASLITVQPLVVSTQN